MEKVNWGILATGSIAHKFARGLKHSRTGVLAATGSRSLEKAVTFATEHGGKPYGRYDDVLTDPSIDAVYIALPHHLHAEWTIKCAEAGKHILCEKPFTLNAKDAERALKEVDKAGVFFMEAFMYRCHPQTRELAKMVREGVIGKPLVVKAEFGFAAGRDWVNFRTVGELGGGGLMDVGTYCVSMCRLIAGEEPIRCEYVANLSPSAPAPSPRHSSGRGESYDEYGTGCLKFPSGMTAMIGTGIHVSLRNEVLIYGTEGSIRVPSPWFCAEPFVVHAAGNDPMPVRIGEGLDLYGQEADAVAECIEQREHPAMTWQDTIGNARTLDSMRASAQMADL
ncbi:MAG: Gfo/Idh/MocA family oxidoreductase [Fimbriimonadaceae bacterium]